MDFKKIRKGIIGFLSWFGLTACSAIVNIMPARFLYSFANFVSFLAYRFAAKQKRIALESLSFAFGREKTAPELEQITRDVLLMISGLGFQAKMYHIVTTHKPKYVIRLTRDADRFIKLLGVDKT